MASYFPGSFSVFQTLEHLFNLCPWVFLSCWDPGYFINQCPTGFPRDTCVGTHLRIPRQLCMGAAFYISYIFFRSVTAFLVKTMIFRPPWHTSATLSRVSLSRIALCPGCSQLLCPGLVSATIPDVFTACHSYGAQTQKGPEPLCPSLPHSPVCTVWFLEGTQLVAAPSCLFHKGFRSSPPCLFLLSAVPTKHHLNSSSTLRYSPALFLFFLHSFLFCPFSLTEETAQYQRV